MRTIFVILLFWSTALYGQNWYIKRSVDWIVPDPEQQNVSLKDMTSFRNSHYESFEALLPVYFEKMNWQSKPSNVEVHFFDAEFQPLSKKFAEDPTFSTLDTAIHIVHRLSGEAGISSLMVSFTPFRRNPETGNVERLSSFVLNIKAQPGITKKSTESRKTEWTSNSILSSGNFYKISIPETGVYKLSYDQLENLGLDDPSKVRIYGWGGHRLPEDVREGEQDDLLPVQIYMHTGQDGIFNSGDHILFYGKGPVSWKYDKATGMFQHDKNPFSDYGFYFVTDDHGNPVFPEKTASLAEEPNYQSQYYDALAWHELDEENLIRSGKEWYGERFEFTTSRNFNFTIAGLEPGDNIKMMVNLLARAKESSKYVVSANGQSIDTVGILPTNLSDYTARHAFTGKSIKNFTATGENVNIGIRFLKPDASAKGWLDFIRLNARAPLQLSEDQLHFRDVASVGNGNISAFTIKNALSSSILWDVTDNLHIKEIEAQLNGNLIQFRTETSSLKEFVLFNPNGTFPSPQFEGEGLGLVENQDLHGAGQPDLVIVAHPDFLIQANRLADYRRDKNGFEVLVTSPQEIYNEFSSGRPDITAIRNYMRMLYQRAGDNTNLMPQYLLFFGDASYIYKSTDPNDGNFVPTYQSNNSLSPIYSYVSDDFFGLLDDGESMYDGLLDIGIGRLPVTTEYQAQYMTDKIIAYETPARMGEWRNVICFIGDDEDNNIHFNQAKELANYVEDHYPAFNANKIFLDAYQQISTPTGQRYPDVTNAINDQISKGALIVNYTGHGGTKGLAHEQILDISDINSWTNQTRLPLFMTATCEFSRFDDPEVVSAGEEVILNPDGGGIALLTTTRLVYSYPNHVLNERFYEIVFEKDENNNNYCLGEIMKYSKNNAGFGVNKRNFTLLGDPAMRLSYPFYHVITDSVNQKPTGAGIDTLKALEEVEVNGHLQDIDGDLMEDFNGIIFPIVYDKATTQSTLANDGGIKQTFKVRKNILYKGKVSVKNGRFSFRFVVPKDISYAFGEGKLSYYAKDSTRDASGAFMNFTVGGSSEDPLIDNEGPRVNVYMNNSHFRSGGITNQNPVLYVEIFDDFGINTTGNGIGHDITAVLENEDQRNIVLNEYYQSDLDNYQSGIVEYPLSDLEEGEHEIKVKVWDIHNNSGEGYTRFIVVKSEEMILDGLMNVPNPVSSSTYFSFEHNKAGQDLEITVDIYTTSGELIKTIKTTEYGSGYRSGPISWDGNMQDGMSSQQGIYIYRISVESSDGQKAVESGKMIIIK